MTKIFEQNHLPPEERSSLHRYIGPAEWHFLQKWRIRPLKDIEPFCDCIKQLTYDNADDHTGCYNCNYMLDQQTYNSRGGTVVTFCPNCECINVVYRREIHPPGAWKWLPNYMQDIIFKGNKKDVVKCFKLKAEVVPTVDMYYN